MNLYRVKPSSNFLEIIATFVIHKFGNRTDLSKAKIILPNGHTCVALQKILTQKQNIAMLPKIIPFTNLVAEGDEIFHLSSINLNKISNIEERILLAEIVSTYPSFRTKIKQSLQFVSDLSKLFYELERNHIDIENIAYLSDAAQWRQIYDFLQFILINYHKKLISIGKTTRANYEINVMNSQLNHFATTSQNVIIAGILGYDKVSWDFLTNLSKLPTGFLILPPIGELSDFDCKKITQEDPAYSLKYLLKNLDKTIEDFIWLNDDAPSLVLDYLMSDADKLNEFLSSARSDSNINHINYYEYISTRDEAKQIAAICETNKDKKIALITNNLGTKQLYLSDFVKNNLSYRDLLGNNLIDTQISQFIIIVSEVLCNYSILKLLYLLKHPFIYNPLVCRLELVLSGKNRFVSSNEEILKLLDKSNDLELKDWFCKIISLIDMATISSKNFTDILYHTISVSEKLSSNLWTNNFAKECSEFLRKLLNFKLSLKIENISDFPIILRDLILNSKYFINSEEENIIIGTALDLALLKFDIIIIPNFNSENYPKTSSKSTWLTKDMIDELGLHQDNIAFNADIYLFYLLLHNKEIILTKSSQQSGKSTMLPPHYMLKLQLILGAKLESKAQNITIELDESVKSKIRLPVKSDFFPTSLSASDIEKLLRTPYSFYAKKILNLTTKNRVGIEIQPSDFGHFLHKILELYTKNYKKSESFDEHLASMHWIVDDLIKNGLYPSYNKKLWSIQLSAIIQKFIEFDEKRRKNSIIIYPELKGEMSLNIADQNIIITAIADRIEIDPNGKGTIIDYKTGIMPPTKDVESLLSPQLIICAMILISGGFGIKIREISELIYVKISNSPPYIESKTINLEKPISLYFEDLKKRLEQYVILKEFDMETDKLSYNDYKHLMRV